METYHEDDKDEENTSAPSERPVPRMPEGILFFDRHHDDMVRGFDPFKEKSDKDDRDAKKKDKAKTDKTGKPIVEPEHREPAAREVGRHVPLPWPEIVPRPTELTETKTAETSEDDAADDGQVATAAYAQPSHAAHMAEADGVFAMYEDETEDYTGPKPIDPAKAHAHSVAAFGVKPKQHAAQPAPEFVRVNPVADPESTPATSPDAPAHTGETMSYDPMQDPDLRPTIDRLKAASEAKANAPTEPTEWERTYAAAVNANSDPYRQPGYGYGGGEWSPAANMATPAMPIERPKHEPIYDNRPRGVAAVAALLGLEHLGRKRADKAQVELIRENAKQQQELIETQQRMAEQQRRTANEQYEHNRQIEQLRSNQLAAAHSGEQFTSAPSAELGGARPTYRQHETAPTSAAMPAIHERIVPGPNAEVQPPVDAAAATAEQTADAINLQPKQRVEHSSWHNIVVERGHAVQDAINYGEGFQRERQQEVLRDSVADATAATAYSASTGAQPSYPTIPHMGVLPSGMTTPSLPQGTSSHVDPQHQLPANTKKTTGGLWFWLMLAIVIAAFFTAAFI